MVNKFTQADDFNETRFWTKIVDYAKKAGREVIEKALWLYYAAQRPDTPVWAKTTIYAALAYFVLPVDAIPDALPVVGFTDDLGVLAGAMGTVSLYINEEVKRQTHDKLADWFG
ncbi:YkvA family protein [Lonsdalea quercina]|uniref:YkvA family protein n=1 Tax=Lonsdalea quercina TaxID=71657 RepID=UPI00397672CA